MLKKERMHRSNKSENFRNIFLRNQNNDNFKMKLKIINKLKRKKNAL
jgi:hypothetical protein